MALIRFKRKKTDNNTDVELQAGEPYYDAVHKHLFVGSTDGESVADKKHISEIRYLADAELPAGFPYTDQVGSDDVVFFQIGEDPNNYYFTKITQVEHATEAETAGTALHAQYAAGLLLSEEDYGTKHPSEVDWGEGPENGRVYIQIEP